MDKIKILQNIINNSNNIVFFGGAGVSTDSGIRDFKGKNGLYRQKYEFKPEYYLSIACFYKDTDKFFDFYKNKMNCLDIEPNITHKYLKKLEDKGKLKGIITQNIDGLHQKAGSKNVYELHGTLYENYCINCNKFFDASFIFNSKDIPKCDCGGLIKPNIVLYGEMLPECYNKAQYLIYKADTLIVAGTSLTVEPANGLLKVFNGNNLIIINDSPTPYDDMATLVINDNLKKVFEKLH